MSGSLAVEGGRQRAQLIILEGESGTGVERTRLEKGGHSPSPAIAVRLLRKADLVPPDNLRTVVRDLRNHLAGNARSMTRDETLAQEMINLFFCKVYDERATADEQPLAFQWYEGEDLHSLHARICALFDRVRSDLPQLFDANDTVRLDPASLSYVVSAIQHMAIRKASRDALGDLFEGFIGPALRGGEGQFFTPRNVVKMLVEMVDPGLNDLVIDPACGAGGFLIGTLEHLWQKLERKAVAENWAPEKLQTEQANVVAVCLRGLDKDEFLARVCRTYLALLGNGDAHIFCENSLAAPEKWATRTRSDVKPGTFDVVFTNPPFGAKIPVTGKELLAQYDLARRWQFNRQLGDLEMTEDSHLSQAPQVLFLERCMQLLRPGGRLGIVLPESMLGNPSYEFVIKWLLGTARLIGVVTLPEAVFKTSGKGGTHTKACVIVAEKMSGKEAKPTPIFMADAKWCGHDSRGNPTNRKMADGTTVHLDDTVEITKRFNGPRRRAHDHLGFELRPNQITDRILVPKYYDPEVRARLDFLESTHDLVQLGELVRRGIIEATTGVEVGKMAYGTGPVPFVRTSDISNWEIKLDPKHGVSQEIYEQLKGKANARPKDILVVRDGTYLIGTSAMVSSEDRDLLFQSHIVRLRVMQPGIVDPYLLFACLNSPIVKRQVRTKQFTQDIIDTLGNRLMELFVPIPKAAADRRALHERTREVIEGRAALRSKAKAIILSVEGDAVDPDEAES